MGTVLLYLIGILAVVLVVDAALRKRMCVQPSFKEFPTSKESSTTQIFALPGFMKDGVEQYRPVLGTMQNSGDVLCVSYGTERFDRGEQIYRIATKLLSTIDHKQPDKISLVLSTLGGPLGLDVWAKARNSKFYLENPVPEVEMIIIGGIQGHENMQGGRGLGAVPLSLLPIGPIFNRVLKRLLGEKPEPSKLWDHTDTERDVLHKPSARRDQLAYAVGHPKPCPANFDGVDRVIYIRFKVNNVEGQRRIDAEAAKWKKAASKAKGVEFVLRPAGAPSDDYGQKSEYWNAVFRKALSGELVKTT